VTEEERLLMNWKRIWDAYVALGMPFGGIKFISTLSWMAFHPVLRLLGLTHQNPNILEYAGTVVIGILSAGLTVLIWPLAILSVLSGKWSVSEILFYPWVLPAGAGWS
jgi:hypothetical protein